MAITRQSWHRVLPSPYTHERTAIGVAIGRRRIDIVIGDDATALQMQVSLSHSRHEDAAPTIPFVLQAICALLAEHDIVTESLLGIGIAMPTLPDVGMAPARAALCQTSQEFGESLREALGVAAYFDTDTNMRTLGESRYGIGHSVRDMLYVALGDTITAGIIMNGRLYQRDAGAIGHMSIDPRGALCWCGQRGCLETRASTAAIIAMAQRQGSTAKTLEHVIAAAQQGHVGCCAALEEAGVALGLALANAVVMLNPALIVLGGATMRAGDYVLLPTQRTTLQHQRIAGKVPVPIMPSDLGSKAGALGGMAAVLDDRARL